MNKAFLTGSTVLALALGAPAQAASVDIEVVTGQQGSFQHSWVHAATGSMTIDGVKYYASGNKLWSVQGSLDADLTGGVLSFTGGNTLQLIGQNVSFGGLNLASKTWELEVLGGGLTTEPNGQAAGTIQYTLRNTTDNVVFDQGTFRFFDEHFVASANTLTESDFTVWGNNWDNVNGSRSDADFALGIDLRGLITLDPDPVSAVVPVPAAAWGGLALLGGLGGLRAAKRRAEQA